MSVGTHTYF